MEQELDRLLLATTKKMKIKLSVVLKREFTEDLTVMDAFAGDPDRVFTSKTLNKTYFCFSFKSVDYVGILEGTTQTELNYAFLLAQTFENFVSREASLSKQEFLKSILLGDSSVARTHKFMTKFAISDSPCFTLSIRSNKRCTEVAELLLQGMADSSDCIVKMDDSSCVIVKFADADNNSRSGIEYGDFLAQSIFEELGVDAVIGVGSTVDNLYDIPLSYQQSETAVRMATLFESKGPVHSYKEFLLVRLLETVPESKMREYMNELINESARTIFEDEEMLGTAEEFLENNLNVSETSRELYMHRNTLMYRLDKIEKATGLNIRNFSDAVTFRLMSILYKLVDQK